MSCCYVWTAQGIKRVFLVGSARVWPHPILEASERNSNIRFRRAQGQTVAQIATAVGLSRAQIYNILKD
jgi:hypothetical protein